MLKKIRRVLGSAKFRGSIATVICAAGLLFFLSYHLGSSPSGLSPRESVARSNAAISAIVNMPINAPFKIIQNGLIHLDPHSHFLLRLPSVIFASIFLACFFYLLKGWFGKSIALLTTIIMAFTPYFILAARSAGGEIMFFTPVAVLASYLLATKNISERAPFFLFLLCVALSLYVPGMAWLLLLGFILRFSRIREIFVEAELPFLLYLLLPLAALVIWAPLAYGIYQHVGQVKLLFLIPAHFASTSDSLLSWLWMLSATFFHAHTHFDLIVDKLPLLNAAEVGLSVFGCFIMWSRLRLELIGIILITLIITALAGINNNYALLGLALPFLAIVVGMGLRYLYIEWRHIFPLNPLAKGFAIALMSALVLIHVVFGIRYSLLAWPNTVATAHTYVVK
jgi:hypothetical protein